MAKTLYVCPDCHKQVKDLEGHQERMHPTTTSSSAKGGNPKKTPQNTGGKKLELETSSKKEVKETETQGYHCVGCGNLISKGQNPCPHCGAALDWSGV